MFGLTCLRQRSRTLRTNAQCAIYVNRLNVYRTLDQRCSEILPSHNHSSSPLRMRLTDVIVALSLALSSHIEGENYVVYENDELCFYTFSHPPAVPHPFSTDL